MTYDELVKCADEYCAKKGYYCSGRDFLQEFLTDGDGSDELNADGYSETYFRKGDDEDFGTVVEYARPVYGDDGEVEDWETVGYRFH